MSIKAIKGYTIYLKKCLGEGSYGRVCEGLQEKTKLAVAIKMIDKSRSTSFITKLRKANI